MTPEQERWVRRLKRLFREIPDGLWLQVGEDDPGTLNVGVGVPTHTGGTTIGAWGAQGTFSANDAELYEDSVEIPGAREIRQRTVGL